MKTVINTDKAPKAVGPYSQAILANGTLYVSGQIPLDPATSKMVEGGVEEQTVLVFENIKAILEEAGFGFEDVVKSTVLLADIKDFAVVNQIYAKYYNTNLPARAAYQVAALPLGALVEIETIAVK